MSESPTAANDDRLLDWVHGNKDAGSSSEIGLASSLYRACLRTMGLLSKQYVASRKPSWRNKSRMVESHARLCLFGDGLLHKGALEHCLKVDDELRDVLRGLLHHLGTTLLQGVECLYYAYDPVRTKEEIVSGLLDLVERDEQTNLDSSESEDSEAECDTTALNEENVLDALDTYTTSLMDLRPVLEQSLGDTLVPQARRPGVQPPEFHVTDSARPYVLQVHDKFRNAKTALVERLGEANWQRYVRLKEMAAAEHPVEGTAPAIVVAEVPKSAFRPISQFHDSGLGTSAPSMSLYATSNASHASFLSSATDSIKGKARVPSTPVEVAEGKTFTCFICNRRLSGIRNRVDWKMHVFADLHPYICTFTDCPDLLTTYPTRQIWAEHELKTHRLHESYQCHDCSMVFPDEAKFVDHLSHDHQHTDLNHTQLLATLSAARKSVSDPLNGQICPLCQHRSWTVQRDFVTHLGRHLEEIALSSLPREDDSESTSDDETSTDIDANASTSTSKRLTQFSIPLPQVAIPKLSPAYSSLIARLQLHLPGGDPRVRIQLDEIFKDLESKPPRDRAASERVSTLFSGNSHLLSSFGQFLPPGFNFIQCGNNGDSDLFEVQTPHGRLPGNSRPKTPPVLPLQQVPSITVQDTDWTADLESPDWESPEGKIRERPLTEKKPIDEMPLPYSKEYEENLLRAWFDEHLDYPYPTEEEKQQFMQRTLLTSNQINNWFMNAREHQLPFLVRDRDGMRYPAPFGPHDASFLAQFQDNRFVSFEQAQTYEPGMNTARTSDLPPEVDWSKYNFARDNIYNADKNLNGQPPSYGSHDRMISASLKLGKMQMDKDTEQDIREELEDMDSQSLPELGQPTLIQTHETAQHEMVDIEQENDEAKRKVDINIEAIEMKRNASAGMALLRAIGRGVSRRRFKMLSGDLIPTSTTRPKNSSRKKKDSKDKTPC